MAPSAKPLTMEDREDISRGLAKGLENKDIAASIGRDESVVSREISRHGGREAYRAWKADAAARESRSRPKERKIDTDRNCAGGSTGDLMKGWSPEQIAGRLRYEQQPGRNRHVRIARGHLHLDLRPAEGRAGACRNCPAHRP